MDHRQTVRSGLVSYIVVTVLVIAAAAIYLYFSYVTSTLSGISDLTVKRKNVWIDITRYSERLVSFEETGEMPDRIIRRVQDRLAEMLKKERSLHNTLDAQIDRLDRFPFTYIHSQLLARIKSKDVPDSVRQYIEKLSISPLTLLQARHSSLTLPDAIVLTNRKIMLPLDHQDEALRTLRSDISAMRTPVEWAVTIGLLFAIWVSWFALLRPSLVRSHELQDKIMMSEQQARTTLSSIVEAVVVTDKDGRIGMLNRAAEKLLGVEEGRASGTPLNKLLRTCGKDVEPQLTFSVDEILATPSVITRRIQMPPRDDGGCPRKIDLSAAPITFPNGTISGVVLVLRDITLDLKIREQLRSSEKARAVSALAGGLAHEFNNTLAIITGASDLMELKIAQSSFADQATRRYLESIKSAVRHSSALTAQLLAIGRKSGFKLAPIDVLAPLSEVIDILRRTTDRAIEITLKAEADEAHRYAQGDSASLQSMFLNFGLNSINAIEPPGAITVSIEWVQVTGPKALALGLDATLKDFIKVQWTDTGRGIPRENLERIFEPFYTTRAKTGGVGLGLSVAQSIVLEHKGSVTATSKLGQGTTFTVYLPCTSERPEIEASTEPGITADLGGCVLLAEDETRNAELMSEYLTSSGFEIVGAGNGREALELYQKHRDKIDVVVLDINLPLMPGHEVARAIHKLDPERAIIISTGYLEPNIFAALQADGITSILKKPYHAGALFAEIAKAQRTQPRREQQQSID
ncbi:MAG TPA: ATP-binding protein [Hyphomicrobiaceae bacterium]|nr:ATP-binding protein [Hyphomicrobiaceae bacterium]